MTTPPTPPDVLPYQRAASTFDPEAQVLAHRSLRMLGPFCTFAGFSCGVLPPLFGGVTPNIIFVAIFSLLGVSGLTYWICGTRIRRGSRSAVVAAVLAAIHLVIFLLWIIFSVIALFQGIFVAIMPLMIALLFSYGLLDLIRTLRRCIRSLDHLRQAA